jgi:pimeloyl-ACP methyl ester carboxylesterase
MLHHIIYKNENQNAPWIVFIHGAGGSSTIWFKQVNSFNADDEDTDLETDPTNEYK